MVAYNASAWLVLETERCLETLETFKAQHELWTWEEVLGFY